MFPDSLEERTTWACILNRLVKRPMSCPYPYPVCNAAGRCSFIRIVSSPPKHSVRMFCRFRWFLVFLVVKVTGWYKMQPRQNTRTEHLIVSQFFIEPPPPYTSTWHGHTCPQPITLPRLPQATFNNSTAKTRYRPTEHETLLIRHWLVGKQSACWSLDHHAHSLVMVNRSSETFISCGIALQ